MDFFRIGDKVINKGKIYKDIEKILTLRSRGHSQQEVAQEMGVDRSFISRLENLGEVRKGKSVGVIGFPIKNKEEIIKTLKRYGVQSYLIMSEAERRRFVEEQTGAELVNEVMMLTREYRSFDTVIVMASDMRTKLIEALLNQQVITLDIGSSPITEDVYVDVEKVEEILDMLL